MTIASEKQIYTPEEYLQLEEKSIEKHEYRQGEIVLMTGGTTNHNKLAGKLYARLLLALEDQNHEVYMGDVRLWIPDYREYTYPDIMVVQGQPVYQSPGKTTITNPTIIVEVLSKSTQARDRGDKFRFYRSVPEFKEYILIDQYTVLVEHFVKTSEHQWLLTEYEAKESKLSLDSVNFEINLEELYKRVNFDEGV
ncbi:MAG: Uma2 family endonuclease [Crocosphaera sp.]